MRTGEVGEKLVFSPVHSEEEDGDGASSSGEDGKESGNGKEKYRAHDPYDIKPLDTSIPTEQWKSLGKEYLEGIKEGLQRDNERDKREARERRREKKRERKEKEKLVRFIAYAFDRAIV